MLLDINDEDCRAYLHKIVRVISSTSTEILNILSGLRLLEGLCIKERNKKELIRIGAVRIIIKVFVDVAATVGASFDSEALEVALGIQRACVKVLANLSQMDVLTRSQVLVQVYENLPEHLFRSDVRVTAMYLDLLFSDDA